MTPSTRDFQDASELGLSGGPEGSGRLSAHKALLEEYLSHLAFSDNPHLVQLVEAMRQSLLRENKRLRPLLCIEAASDFGLNPEDVLPSAAAIELVFAISQIHNNLPGMDGRRRDVSRYSEEFGEATAILAGDGFFGEALSLITVHQKGRPERVLQVVQQLAESTGVEGMVGGQSLSVDHAQPVTDRHNLEDIYELRWGSLIRASARIGAILAGATSERQEAVADFAWHLGICSRVAYEITTAANDDGHRQTLFIPALGLLGARNLGEKAVGRALVALEKTGVAMPGLSELAAFVCGEAGIRVRD